MTTWVLIIWIGGQTSPIVVDEYSSYKNCEIAHERIESENTWTGTSNGDSPVYYSICVQGEQTN